MLVKNLNNPLYTLYVKFIQSHLLMREKRFQPKIQAYKLLKEIVSEDLIDFEINTLSYLYISDFLLDEYKFSKEESIIEEILYYSKRLEELLESNPTHSYLKLQVGIINSRIHLIQNDFTKALDILEMLEQSIENDDYNQISTQVIEDERFRIKEDLTSITNLLNNNKQFVKNAQIEDIKTYLREVAKIVSRG